MTFTSSQAAFSIAYDVTRGFILFPFSSHYLIVCGELCTFCQCVDIYLHRPLSQVLSQIGFCRISAVECQKVLLCFVTRSDCLTVIYFILCQSWLREVKTCPCIMYMCSLACSICQAHVRVNCGHRLLSKLLVLPVLNIKFHCALL